MDLSPLEFVIAVLCGYFGVAYLVLSLMGLSEKRGESE